MKCPLCHKYQPLWSEDDKTLVCVGCPHRYMRVDNTVNYQGLKEGWFVQSGIYSCYVTITPYGGACSSIHWKTNTSGECGKLDFCLDCCVYDECGNQHDSSDHLSE